MAWLAAVGQLVLGFIIGTFVLWICSLTVNTQNATLKVSAIYNATMTVLAAIVMGIGLLFLATDSSAAAAAFFISAIVTLIVSFVLLMRLYGISFLATIWLVIAMWAIDMGVKKLAAVIF